MKIPRDLADFAKGLTGGFVLRLHRCDGVSNRRERSMGRDGRKQNHLLFSHVRLELGAEIREYSGKPRQSLAITLVVNPVHFLQARTQGRELTVQVCMMCVYDV